MLKSSHRDESTIVDHAFTSIHRTKNKKDEMKLTAILCKKRKETKTKTYIKQFFQKKPPKPEEH